MKSQVVKETQLLDVEFVGRGKVRDVYKVRDNLLIVSTDRLSAFDVILPDPIPYKGKVLNSLSIFWMNRTANLVPNHFITSDVSQYPEELRRSSHVLEGRSMMVRKARTFPVECVVRGYIIGGGWKDYLANGHVCGIPMPQGLKQAEKLPEPIFTPSTKAEMGNHDENISFGKVKNLVGDDTARWLKDKTIELYLYGSVWAEKRGIIIADTKFEFGLVDDKPTLIDEVLTPDSSRFWPTEQYCTGVSPPSLDKQFVRDYLEGIKWDKTPPAPSLPQEIIMKTTEKYLSIYQILTGRDL
ncbi:MAG: phosphoribosylaminoimidazolesuccinocarboxamide synthase [Deltaproteobacteria bacterium]|nr:phosphoribosylaminoimidazolesuccinocarboxamide synthase [Deltaproteobacteria bacterium]